MSDKRTLVDFGIPILNDIVMLTIEGVSIADELVSKNNLPTDIFPGVFYTIVEENADIAGIKPENAFMVGREFMDSGINAINDGKTTVTANMAKLR